MVNLAITKTLSDLLIAGMTVVEQPTVECDANGLIARANEAWCALCEFDQADVAAGCRLSAIQGPGTDLSKVALIMQHVQAGLPNAILREWCLVGVWRAAGEPEGDDAAARCGGYRPCRE